MLKDMGPVHLALAAVQALEKYACASLAGPQMIDEMTSSVWNYCKNSVHALLLTSSRLWEERQGHTGGCGHGLADRAPE